MAKGYTKKAKADACDMAENFLDEIVEQVAGEGRASHDYVEDYPDGDRYHNDSHVDKWYSFRESCDILTELDDLSQQLLKRLWDGDGLKKAIMRKARHAYGDSVLRCWGEIIEWINEDAEVKSVRDVLSAVVAIEYANAGWDVALREAMKDYYEGEVGSAKATAMLRTEIERVIGEQRP